MQHNVNLSAQEKLKACLDLSDFIYHMTRQTLTESEFNKKLKRLRQKHLQENIFLLKRLGKFHHG